MSVNQIRCFRSVFGLATLIFNGLEIAMHATMNDKNCVDDVVIAHPILQVSMMTIMMTVRNLTKRFYMTIMKVMAVKNI